MKSFFTLLLIFTLSGCASSDFGSSPRRLSNEEVQKLSKDHLCVLTPTYNDERINKRIAQLNLDCSPKHLFCQGKGYKKGSKNYSACLKTAQGKLNEIGRMQSPDYLHCSNMGFKSGTAAMATCLSAYQEQQATTRLIQLQQQSIRQSQTRDTLNFLSNQLNQKPEPRSITNTNCHVSGSSMNCTTW